MTLTSNMTPEERTQLAELIAWKKARETQQITFPIDSKSVEILQNYFMRILGTLSSFGVGGDVETSYIGKQANLEFIVGKNQFIPYAVDIVNDLIIPSMQVGFENGQKIYFISEDTFPGGMGGIDYFVINAAAGSFQITTIAGDVGSIVDITSVGVGRQWLWSFGF